MNAAGDWGSRGEGRVKMGGRGGERVEKGGEGRRRKEKGGEGGKGEMEGSRDKRARAVVAHYNTANEGAYERKYDEKMEKEKWNLASFPDLPTIQF